MSDLKLCYGCMEPLGSDSVCAHCGYDQNSTSLANYLKPGTVLHERYLVGKMLAANGEGVTYIGYDKTVDCKLLIREYFPERLCSRVTNGTAVNVKYDHLAQYKALMAEYTDLNKALERLRNLSHLNPALELFTENNTTYAVYEYLEGCTLLDYLKENAGELSWNTVRRIFPPLFTTLSLLHNAGVLHRGLSPETIFVTDKGELKLLGFSISAVRTNDTELDAELFDGYAAPEQYFADRQQGTWTDVYGICAVLYRILTGCRATDAISRQDYDILVPPAELNPQVPENVSDGIMQGLRLDSNARIRTITDLVTLLFEEEIPEQPEQSDLPAGDPDKGTTAVFQAHHSQPKQHTGSQQKRPTNTAAQVAAAKARANGQRRPAQSGSSQQHRRPSGNGTQAHRNPQHRNGTANRSAASSASRAHQQNRNASNARRRPSGGISSKARELTVFERIRAPLMIAFLFITIITIVVLALIKISKLLDRNNPTADTETNTSSVSDNVLAPVEDSDAAIRYDAFIPDIVGMNFQIKRDEYAGWLTLEPEYEFSEKYVKDQIFWQEFEENTEFASGVTTMKVKVSLGSSIITIPNFKGLRLQSYLKKLEEMGLAKAVDGGGNNNMGTANNLQGGTTPNNKQNEAKTTTTTSKNGKIQSVIYKATVNYEYQNGYVCGVEPAVGDVLDALDDYEIIVYYAYNPVFETVANESVTTKSGTTAKGKTTSTKTTAKSTATEANTTEEPQQTLPPATLPPATLPPATLPPTTDPPVTQAPPATEVQPPPQNTDPPANVTPPDVGGDPPAE
ncbi:MAG: protein kinase [Oscillospiraceae bacterium]|nr:protein kinase [Oscillospiraceae bacterium]